MLDLYNFVLCISNNFIMKKTILTLALVGGVLGGTITWLKLTPRPLTMQDSIQFVIIILLVVFALVFLYNRVGNIKSGLPPEDELSKKMLKVAAARSYYFSLFLWLAISYMSESSKLETHTLIGLGILCMAVLLGIHWIVIKITGLKDE